MADDFVIRIRADDAATATVKKIQAALSKVTDPVDKAQKRVGKFGDMGQASLAKLHKSFGKVANSASKVVDKIVEIIPGLTAIGGAASLAGLSALATKFGEFGFSLNKSSKLLGMNAQDLAAWHVAAKRAGVSAEEFDSAMSGSQMAIRGAANGADPHAMTLLQKMGVQIARNKDGTVDYYATQMRLMKAIPKLKTVEAQRDVAGSFGMGGLLPMLQQGTYDADKARAMREGLVPTDAEIAKAKAFNEDVSDLRGSAEGLGNSIGSALIPVLDPVVKKMSAWLNAHRAEIAEKISAAVQKFVNWISSINWDDVTSKAKALWDNLGGVKGVVETIAAIKLVGPISSVLSLITNLTKLTTMTIPRAVGALARLGGSPIIAGILAMTHSEDLNTGEDDYLKAHQAKPGQKWDGDSVGNQHAAVAAAATKDPKTAHAMALMQSLGWTKAQAAGIVANLWTESNLNSNIVGDHGAAYGIGQWHADRQAQFKAWAGHDIRGSSLDEQLRFVNYDLREGANWSAGRRLHAATTSDDSGRIVSHYYERPRNVAEEMDKRGSLANAIAGVAPQGSLAASQAQGGSTDAPQASQDDAANSRVAAMQQAAPTLQQHTVTFDFKNVPAGARVDAKSPDGGYLPTKINYAMSGNGAMP